MLAARFTFMMNGGTCVGDPIQCLLIIKFYFICSVFQSRHNNVILYSLRLQN